MKRRSSARLLPPLLALATSCATQGGQSNNGINLPSSGDGPFRPIVAAELPRGDAPYVFGDTTDDFAEPAVIAASDDPTSEAVWMYAVATRGGHTVIVRTRADDGRSFYGDIFDNEQILSGPQHTPPTVLSADQAWEGKSVSGPSALQTGGQTWLYYAGDGGIGLATSSDGLTFTKQGAAVLPVDATATWETTPPHAPSVAVFPDGTWHMLYGAGNAIGEATSADGVSWTRAPGNPVLTASPADEDAGVAQDAGDAGPAGPFDQGGVDDPVLAPQVALDGRVQVRVLYTGYLEPPGAKTRDSAIGLAGRYGDSGPLSRQPTPIYTVQLHERGPALFEWSGGSMLYVSEDDLVFSSSSPFTPGIAAGYAPIAGTLPPPLPYASSP